MKRKILIHYSVRDFSSLSLTTLLRARVIDYTPQNDMLTEGNLFLGENFLEKYTDLQKTNLYSLKGDRNFRRLKRGSSSSNKYFSVRWLAHRYEPSLKAKRAVFVGIVITKKIGKSVIRNYIKRRLREALRAILAKEPLKKSYIDMIIIVRPEATSADFWQLKDALSAILNKTKLL